MEIVEVEDPLYNVYHDPCYEIDQLSRFGIQDVIFEINWSIKHLFALRKAYE